MNAFWAYFWPLAAFGLLAGALFASLALRRRRRSLFGVGAALCLAAAALWHWPLGASERFTTKVEGVAEFVLADWEMSQVSGRLHRDPISRRLLLSGEADDFQRGELVRIMSTIPGVSSASWSNGGGVPLIAEGGGAALLGFLIGAVLAYVFELRRRYNAQWRW